MDFWQSFFITVGLIFLVAGLVYLFWGRSLVPYQIRFSAKPNEEREQYDTARIGRAFAALYLVGAGIYVVAFLVSTFVWRPLGWAGLAVVLIWFFGHVKLMWKQDFEAYRFSHDE